LCDIPAEFALVATLVQVTDFRDLIGQGQRLERMKIELIGR
jgi:hypothetical protein